MVFSFFIVYRIENTKSGRSLKVPTEWTIKEAVPWVRQLPLPLALEMLSELSKNIFCFLQQKEQPPIYTPKPSNTWINLHLKKTENSMRQEKRAHF
jgi:hypothetical protein